jgi:small redox-active disulfide protein 2
LWEYAVTEQEQVVKIRVGEFTVGIVGLKGALEEADRTDMATDDAVAEYLLKQLKKKNYIPPRSEFDYAQAFLKEFKKHRGENVKEERQHTLEVKVLGPGCPNCERLEHMVYSVMAAESIVGDVEHVRDPNEIATYGLVATPALIINGEVKSSGRLPKEQQLRAWLKRGKRR